MSKLALLILLLSLLISKNAIEGDRNVNHRSLQSGNIQDLQSVNYFGNYLSRDEPINYSEKRKFFRGLLKIFYCKLLFFLWVNLNLGSRYQPRDYRRQSKYEKKMRRLKRKKKRQRQFKKKNRRQYDYLDSYERGEQTLGLSKSDFNCFH